MNEGIEVLIVEDDIRIAEIHRRFTEKVGGFKVIGTATTGEQAKEWLDLVSPQLVLLDVYLPDMQGTELITYIRRNLNDTDIIMITAASEVEVVHHALRGGAADYIVKPLMFDRFKRSLENYKKKIQQLKTHQQLSPEQIENLWFQKNEEVNSDVYAPKGIDPLTLTKIKKHVLMVGQEGITAEMLSLQVGVSRSTARRYLEYLISEKKIHAELIYGSVGRPERRYFRISS
ncbi:response regulator [Bacillus sp. Xin]|uniref:response regulator n=1 Tax=unclassified Bacillus (in: firmicutes) TaxID=185979 RepID=UPI001574C617|nr:MULTISPECIES: response regulator [unclassified Bacillus (in: firmicutes)]MBC6971645.1 response regulator [Bacillus sp. Xin]NSW39049.1 response regulator [Bacillus sp. Xin1]